MKSIADATRQGVTQRGAATAAVTDCGRLRIIRTNTCSRCARSHSARMHVDPKHVRHFESASRGRPRWTRCRRRLMERRLQQGER